MIDSPETQLVETPEGVFLAYQVFGEGSVDILLPMPGGVALDLAWDDPAISAGLRRLASFSRVMAFDCRGFGSSSRVDPTSVPALQTWSDGLGSILTEGGREKAAVFTWGEAASAAMFFAATYPERVTSMVLMAFDQLLKEADSEPSAGEHSSVPDLES